MNKVIAFIERHKYGILITVAVHIGLFVYFQIATYKEAVLFQPWEFTTANDEVQDDIQISPDQIQTPEEQLLQNEEISSFVKNMNDSRDRSNKKNVNYTSSQSYTNAEQLENDYEQSLKDEIRRKRMERNRKQTAASSSDDPKKEPKENTKENESNTKTSGEAIAGQTMVSYSLIDRHPLNHNDWYVRNPGYTCGNVNGTVLVRIEVGVGGKVINAEVDELGSKNASPCMKEKAKEYALISRFNYASSAPKKQEGTITYRFVYR